MGAAAGVIFVALLALSAFLAPAPPKADASVQKIANYYLNHRKALLGSAMFGTFAIVFFLWFLGHLRHVLQRAEGGHEALSPIVFGSGVALATIGFISGIPGATLAYHTARTGDRAAIRLLFDMGNIFGPLIGIIVGGFLAATATAMIMKELVAPWLGWAGLAVALYSFVTGGLGIFATKGALAGNGVVGLVGFVAFMVWVLVASAAMIQHPEVVRERATPAIFAH